VVHRAAAGDRWHRAPGRGHQLDGRRGQAGDMEPAGRYDV